MPVIPMFLKLYGVLVLSFCSRPVIFCGRILTLSLLTEAFCFSY